jgi:undecaprenyl-diphosphatase
MSSWLINALLGLVEGLTEFLPISSTGHLLLTERLLHVQRSEVFNVVIQTGAVVAVLAVFTRQVKDLIVNIGAPTQRDYVIKLLLAFGITAVGGIALKKLGMTLPKEMAPVAYATLVGGVLFLLVEYWLKGRTGTESITWTLAVAFGVGQLLAAAFPGASRSGTTILIALVLGLSRPAAAQFSFLLGIPTLLAAGAKELLDAVKLHAEHEPWVDILFATVVAAASAFLVVRWFLGYIRTHTFNPFGWYRIILGVAVIVWLT